MKTYQIVFSAAYLCVLGCYLISETGKDFRVRAWNKIVLASLYLLYGWGMIAPVSSWAAAVSGYVNSESVSGIQMFIKQIPYNYYCLLTIVMMFVISIINLDYGPMRPFAQNWAFISTRYGVSKVI